MLEDLLLELEAHLILHRDPLLKDLDGDLAAEGGLRFRPHFLTEVRLREATGAELERKPRVVQHELVAAGAGDAGDGGCPLRSVSTCNGRPAAVRSDYQPRRRR